MKWKNPSDGTCEAQAANAVGGKYLIEREEGADGKAWYRIRLIAPAWTPIASSRSIVSAKRVAETDNIKRELFYTTGRED
jgi:hypothetical protein